MGYETSKQLGSARDREGNLYVLRFDAEVGHRAVVSGPKPGKRGATLPEVHAEPATDTVDARNKLVAWVTATGWTLVP